MIALLAVTFLLLGVSPRVGLSALWVGAFGDADGHLYPLSETLVKTTPLLLTGLGVVVAWRGGMFSVGAEGQLIVGATAGAAVGLWGSHLPGFLITLLVLSAGAGAGAAWGYLAGWLRVRRNVQEVISTIMLNYIALSLLGALVEGPLQEKTHRVSQSNPLPNSALLPHLFPRTWTNEIQTRLHSGILIAVFAAFVVMIYLFYTAGGFKLRVVGQNPEAARAARYEVDALRLRAMLFSGALCGLAGATELLGITGRLYKDFSPGWGYTAIPVALLGGLHPLGTLLSALFFGALTAGTGHLSRFSNVSSVLVNVIQAVAVLAFVGIRAFRNRQSGGE
ncbi:MAG: ABC transporter permease [Chthonomonadaceae bacterium]|nr:ABC transporter permease [Chthonomonadaceae bacterium]